MQTPIPPVILAHFLRQIESHHLNTPSRTPLPLHYDSKTQSLAEFMWPWNPELRARVAPSQMEVFRRTHDFKAPCCLCAFLDGVMYTETRIGVVQELRDINVANGQSLDGQYVAVCAKKRCGYFLCLERFYPLHSVKLQKHAKRAIALHPQELNYISDIRSYTAGEPVGGLRQIMSHTASNRLPLIKPDAAAERRRKLFQDLQHGIPEATFWDTFAQCFVCKSVMFRQCIVSYHVCEVAERAHKRFKPYSSASTGASHLRRATRRVSARLLRTIGDVPEAPRLRALPSSPAPTEVIPDSELDRPHEDQDTEDEDGGADDVSESGGNELPFPSSDFELPTVLELVRGTM